MKMERPPQREVEPLLAQANLFRARGNLEEAERICHQALSLDDSSWQAHELLADLLRQQNRWQEALAEYRRAFSLNPSRAPIEEKIARLVLQQAEQERLFRQAREALEQAPRERRRNPSLAVLMSLLIPGTGQIYNRQYLKGGVLALLVVAFALLLALALGKAVSAGGLPSEAPGGTGLERVLLALLSWPGIAWLIALFLTWIYGILDAGLGATARERPGPLGT